MPITHHRVSVNSRNPEVKSTFEHLEHLVTATSNSVCSACINIACAVPHHLKVWGWFQVTWHDEDEMKNYAIHTGFDVMKITFK